MSQHTGMRLGSCEILSLIGAGGMGKVYKARDTRLGREVAVKVLPENFAADPERMARLEREARILASLNHPNIAAIHSLEKGALVMEYVDGPTMAERMARGPIPLDEALPIARQIAEALGYAHERGIIHRDLKPANVKLTAEGAVKVLDFGLAKAVEGEPTPGDPATSPTLTVAATGAGVILGTAAYMSPEQARGKQADKRADIWAFGVVLYEMLAGQRLFEGENVSDTLASVLKEPIDWSPLPASTPPAIRKLLRRCLERDRRRRLQDIGDALLEIDEALEGKPEQVATPRRAVLPWVVAAALAIALGVLALRQPGRPPEQPLMRLDVDLGPNADLELTWGANPILSPDGTRLVYTVRGPDARKRLVTRLLGRREATTLPGTEEALSPFFSPDGQWVAFFAGQKLKKVSVAGGATVAICDAGPVSGYGGSWGEDGAIIAALTGSGGLSKIPAAGGAPQLVTQPDERSGENSHLWPQLLPGGESVLYTAGISGSIHETGSLVVQSLKTGHRKLLWRGGYYGRYLPSGHVLYLQHGALFAIGFNPGTWQLTGAPVPLEDNVASNSSTGGAQFDFSRTGTFIYTSGEALNASLVWLDGAGGLAPTPAKPGPYLSPRLSPDGKRLALLRREGGSEDLWIYEWKRDVWNRLTLTPEPEACPIWSPDGKHLAFLSGRDIYHVPADGSSRPKRLTDGKAYRASWSFSPDGKTLVFQGVFPNTGWDIWRLPLESAALDDARPRAAEPFLHERGTQSAAAISPDGRWLAYASNESGRFEVYVQPFPQGGAKWQVSSGGGWFSVWSRAKPELFYRTRTENRIMAVTYSVKGGAFVPGTPRLWSDKRLVPGRPLYWNFDLAPDGNRVIALIPAPGEEEDRPETRLTFLLNFFDELRRRVPAGGK